MDGGQLESDQVRTLVRPPDKHAAQGAQAIEYVWTEPRTMYPGEEQIGFWRQGTETAFTAYRRLIEGYRPNDE